ncbi:MAG: peptidylprolyl isomerase [Candidatus Eisenbacteria bacterium]|nr:peptidylprolyl isomerase [Candidatus Eisenbacteria bacterium]
MRRVIGYLFLLLILLSACGSQSKSVVATAGKRTITLANFEKMYTEMDPRFLPEGTGSEAKHQFLNDMVNKELMAQEAWKLGIDKVKNVQWQIGEQRKGIVLQRLYEEMISKKVKVKKGDLSDQYKKRSEEFHVKHILVRDQKEADSLLVELRKGADFDTLAQSHSMDRRSSRTGGDMGFITAGSAVDPQFEKAMYRMKQGELSSAPVKTEAGYHIIKVIERRKREQDTFDKEKTTLEKEVRQTKEKLLVAKVIEDLKKKYVAKLEEKNLEAFSSILQRRENAAMDTSRTKPEFKVTPEESSLVIVRVGRRAITVGQYLKVEEALPMFQWTRGGNLDLLRKLLAQGQYTMNEILFAEADKRGIEKDRALKEELQRKAEELMVTQLYYEQIVQKASVSDEEAKGEYQRDPKAYEKDGKPIPFDTIKFDIKQNLLVGKQEEALQNYFAELRKSYPVKINEKVLEKAKLQHAK